MPAPALLHKRVSTLHGGIGRHRRSDERLFFDGDRFVLLPPDDRGTIGAISQHLSGYEVRRAWRARRRLRETWRWRPCRPPRNRCVRSGCEPPWRRGMVSAPVWFWIHRRRRVAWREAIDVDTAAGELAGQSARHHDECGLGRAVERVA